MLLFGDHQYGDRVPSEALITLSISHSPLTSASRSVNDNFSSGIQYLEAWYVDSLPQRSMHATEKRDMN